MEDINEDAEGVWFRDYMWFISAENEKDSKFETEGRAIIYNAR